MSRYSQDYRDRTRYDSNNRVSYKYNARGNQRYGRFNNNNNSNRMGVTEIKIMIGIGVGHMKDRAEIEETVEA